MTEHDDRNAHDAKAEELEYELAEMQERTDALEKDIEGAGEEWERRKADDKVPGAAGEPEQADDPEAEHDDDEKLDFGRALAEDDGGDDDDEKG